MATFQSTFSSLLGTVGSTATAITSTVDALNTGATMLNRYAAHHAEQQAKDYKVLSLSGDKVAARRAAQAEVTALKEVAVLNMSPTEQALYDTTYAEVLAALKTA